MKFDPIQRKNKLQTMVSSYLESDDKSLKINQDAKISRIDINENKDFTYHLKSKNHGVYTMLISGKVNVSDYLLEKRDALGISNTDQFILNANKNSEILFIEVPMNY